MGNLRIKDITEYEHGFLIDLAKGKIGSRNVKDRKDEDLTKKLDEIVKNSKFLSFTRPQLIEAILYAFFKHQKEPLEIGRRLVIIKRNDNKKD